MMCALPGCNREAIIAYCSKKHGDRHRKRRQRNRNALYCQKCGVVDCPQTPKSKICQRIRVKALSDHDISRENQPGEMSRLGEDGAQRDISRLWANSAQRDIRHKDRDINREKIMAQSTIMSRLGEKSHRKEHNRDIDRDNRDTVTSRYENFPGTKNEKNGNQKLPPIRGKPEKSPDFAKFQARKKDQKDNFQEKILNSGKIPESSPPYNRGGISDLSGGVREDPQISILLESWRWHQFSLKINYHEPMDNELLQIFQKFLKKEKGLNFQTEELKNTFRIKKPGVKALNAKTTATLFYSTRSLEMRFSAFSSPATWDQVKGACLQDFIYYCNQAAPLLQLHLIDLDFKTIHINRNPEAAHEDTRTGEHTVEISGDKYFSVPVTLPNGSTYIIWVDWSLHDLPEQELGKGRTFDGLPDPDATGKGRDNLSRFYQSLGSGEFEKTISRLGQAEAKNAETNKILADITMFHAKLIDKLIPPQPTQDENSEGQTEINTEPVILAGYG